MLNDSQDFKGDVRSDRKGVHDEVAGRNIYEKGPYAYIENGFLIESLTYIAGPYNGQYIKIGDNDGLLGIWLVDKKGNVEPYCNDLCNISGGTTTIAWGDITGTLSNQTDLQLALDSIISADGSIDTHSDVDTTTSAPGIGEVLGWDGSNWIPQAAGGGGSVSSVFGRTGAVVAVSGDYNASQITNAFDKTSDDSDDITEGATNLFFTSTRFDTQFALKDTDDLSEGATNLYFTDTRVSASPSVVANTAKVSFPEAPVDGSQYARKNAAWEVIATGGDMSASVYDPTNVAGDVFDMDNMVEGTANLILTPAERAAIITNTAKTSFPGFTDLLTDYGFVDNSTDWDTAFGWGNHATAGYLTSETDPVWIADKPTYDSHIADGSIHFLQAAISIPASQISDFDTEVSNNTDVTANTASRHDPVTVTDTAEIDLSLTGQDISADIVAGSIDETKLDASVNASLDLADSAIQSNAVNSVNGKTGTVVINATDLADFDTEVSNNADVTANTAKVGITPTQASDITTNNAKISYTDAAAVALNTAKVTNATHTGDVTGSTVLTIANDAVDIAMLSATGTPSATTFLRGDNTWATPSGGGSSPLTTKGDVYTYSTTDARLPVGTNGQVLTADSAETTGLKWTTPSGGGSAPTENIILTGTKTSGQNINGVEGTETDLTWDVVSQDTGELTSFTTGDSKVVFTNAGWLNIHSSAYISNGTVNNRGMYSLSLYHYDSSDTLKYSYHGDMQYNRDDNNAYDASGGDVSQSMMLVAAGDYIYIRTRVFDDGTSTATQVLSTTYSKIRIAQIVF